MSNQMQDINAPESRVERLFGDLETFDLILSRVLRYWGSQGTVVPTDNPRYLLDSESTHALLCQKIRSLEGGRDICWECDLRHAEEAARVQQSIDYVCDSGLLDVAVPIMVYGQSIATIFFGQRRISDDPDFEAEALKNLRQTEKRLHLESGALQELWDTVDTLTREEVEQAKADVERIATFIAQILTDREEMQILSERSAALEAELDKLSLTNLEREEPVTSFWHVLSHTFSEVCSIFDVQAGVLMRGDPSDTETFIAQRQHPLPTRRGQAKRYAIPEQKWRRVVQRGVSVVPLAEFEKQYQLPAPFSESEIVCPQEAEAVMIPVQIDDLQDVRVAFILVGPPLPNSSDLKPWLPLGRQAGLFQMLASRLKLSYSAVLRYYERFLYAETRRQYIQDVTHQLVGPLSGIRAHCENLLRGRVSPQRGRKILEALVEEAGMLQRYAENFGYAARTIESGQSIFEASEWQPKTCDAKRLVSYLIRWTKSFQGQAVERGLTGPSVDEVSFRGFPHLMLDLDFFEVLILNLCDNAVKYSYESAPITISGRVLGNRVEIEVTSHGIPLKPEDVESIFQKYTRTAQAEAFHPTGTGIGLFICDQIARLHKGSIRALPSKKSLYGNEVKFIITLPAAKEHRR